MAFLVDVLGGALIQFVLGGLWYGPIAGSLWLKFAFREGKPPKDANMSLCHGVTIVANFGLNALLKLCFTATSIQTFYNALVIAVALWSFVLFMNIPHVFYGQRSLVVASIDEMYQLIVLLVLMVYHCYLSVPTPI